MKLVHYLRAEGGKHRTDRLVELLGHAIRKEGGLELLDPTEIVSDLKTRLDDVVGKFSDDRPILVIERSIESDKPVRLRGFLMPFDLL
jgi:hypothetical protein